MGFLFDIVAPSVPDALKEFERRGFSLNGAQMTLSVGPFRPPGGPTVAVAAVLLKQMGDTSAVRLNPFKTFSATLMDDTPLVGQHPRVLNGARIREDGLIELCSELNEIDGVILNGVILKDLSFRTAQTKYPWSKFDTYVVELAAHRLRQHGRIYRSADPSVLPFQGVDFAEVARIKIPKLSVLLNYLQDELERIAASDIWTAEGHANFQKWKGRASLRSAIARTLKRSGMRDAREPSFGSRVDLWDQGRDRFPAAI